MKKQITELRIRIDGLAQLVKTIGEKPLILVSTADIGDSRSLEEIIEEFKKAEPSIIYKVNPEPTTVVPIYSYLRECHTSLILGKAWLCKVLGELGAESPYKNDGNRKTVKDIEPTADTYDFSDKLIRKEDVDKMEYVSKIDWIRQEIKQSVEVAKRFIGCEFANDFESDFFDDVSDVDWDGIYDIDHLFKRVEQHLSEARFHLGFELQRLKESEV